MDWDNQTGLQAALFRGKLPSAREEVLAVVVAKVGATIGADGRMTIERALAVPVVGEPVRHPYGTVPSDVVIRKQGLDVLVLGRAHAPALGGATESRVKVRVGSTERSLCVFGARQWYRRASGHWAVSEPEPFDLLELSWENAFGGLSWDEALAEIAHPQNPDGMGFIAHESAIEGTFLPHLEDPEQRIRDWRDRPRPCSLAPAPKHLAFDAASEPVSDIDAASPAVKSRASPAAHSAPLSAEPRAPASLKAAPSALAEPKVGPSAPAEPKAEPSPYRVPERLWNDAVPRFQFPRPSPGAAVVVDGVWEQPISWTVPQFRLICEIRLAQDRFPISLELDTLLFFPESQRCSLTWRASFRYPVVAKQARCARLTLEE